MEEWKQINEYNYKISNFGRIKRRKNAMVPIFIDNGGYYWFHLWKNDKCKKKYVHRLVIEYFCKRIDKSKHIVDHINRVRTDNRADNLRWVTAKENMNNRVDNRPRECG